MNDDTTSGQPPSDAEGTGNGNEGQGWAGQQPPSNSAPDPESNGRRLASPVRIGPMTMADVFDNTFKLLKANWKQMAIAILVVGVPYSMLEALNFVISTDTDSVTSFGIFSGGSNAFIGLIEFLFLMVATPLLVAVLVRIATSSMLGHQLDVQVAAKGLLPMWSRLVLASVLAGLAVIGGLIACVIPGLFVAVLLSAVVAVVAVEEAKPIEALRRSWTLMSRRLGPYMGTLFLTLVLSFFVTFVVQLVPAIASGVFLAIGLDPIAWVFLTIANLAGLFVSIPISALVPALLYFDARVRFEGFDVQMMAANLDQEPPASPTA